MAANNGGGGRQANNQLNEHVEFSVKAEEDLYLTGSENTIKRVTAETNYSCLMLKTQRFSSLFRHYAKYHGLRKDDLEYYFCNLLENEDTPETVQLQRGDTIMVRKRRKQPLPEAAADDAEFFKDMRELLHAEKEEHMDCTFVLQQKSKGNGNSKTQLTQPQYVKAHKSILTARSDYFQALFRTNTFRESKTNEIRVDDIFTAQHVRWVLEFLYTNRITDLTENNNIGTDDLLCLLHLADKWQLRDLKRLCELELVRTHMTIDSVARLYGATEDFNAQRLARACIEFIMSNLRQLAGNTAFEEEMKHYPHLCIPVLKAAADLIPDGPLPKKQRLTTSEAAAAAAAAASNNTPSSAAALAGSSPVPDSDT